MTIWDCPTGRELVGDIADVMQADSHCLLLLPNLYEIQPFVDCVRDYIDIHLGSVQTFSVGDDGGLREALREILEADPQSSLEDLVFTQPCMGSYFVAHVSENLGERGKKNLLGDLAQLATASKHCREQTNSLNWRLLLVLPGTTGISLPLDVFLRPYECWGWFKTFDLEYAVDRGLKRYLGAPADYHWLHALCLGLAHMDPELVEVIAAATPRTMDDIADLMRRSRAYELAAGARSNMQNLAHTQSALTGFWPEKPAPGCADACWRLGVYNLNCFGIPDIHPAALAACKLSRTLEQQVVRGQIQIYLPLVQKVQALVLQKVEEIKQNWPEAGKNFEEGRKEEIGPLALVLYQNKGYYPRELVELAQLWKPVRNKLAHNTFLPYEEAVRAYDALDALDRSGQRLC